MNYPEQTPINKTNLTITVPRLADVQEVAEYLKLSDSYVYTLVSKKKIPHAKIGENVRFDMVDIQEWVNSKKVYVNAPQEAAK
jgi:excisionase family DNA binding protein